MSVNLDAVFWTLRAATQHMIARAEAGDPGGSLLVTSSTSALHGAPANEAYAASKTAVLGLIRGLAVEYARYGIRANAVLPGWIRSDMTANLQGWDKFNDKVIGRVPMRRWGDPEDFAGIAVYLASDASRFHTGDSMVIDGGYTIF
jgi:NAD(P)-dependent dehydrogenase (short-subunit alcohol dehydrogenase family)